MPGPDGLADHCRVRLARHKVPRIRRFVERLPLTGSGKIQKFALRAQLLSEPPFR